MSGMPMRKCSGPCGETKPLTREHFDPHEGYVGKLSRQCRDCRSSYQRARTARLRRAKLELIPLRDGEICSECSGLAHRVEGRECWRRKLPFAEEPALQLSDFIYRHREREVI